MAEPETDPVLNDLREQIAGVDRFILDAVDRRLELVARLKRHKAERENSGSSTIALTKRELA